MNKEKLKKFTRKALVVLVVIYLLCLVYCTASVFTMQALTYNSMGWGAILAEYKLDFAEDSIE